jgi:hypothetical protein
VLPRQRPVRLLPVLPPPEPRLRPVVLPRSNAA